MPRRLTAGLLAASFCLVPATASADLTAFLGAATAPSARSARGFALGLSLIIVGFEVEYSSTAEEMLNAAPSLKTGMVNGLLQTPTRTQLYVTAGGGLYRERTGNDTETHVGTNVGGGVKVALAGPLRLRLDYRVYALRGAPRHRTPQRLYAGLNLAF
jgi:opacity protein-like surface antigen